jgi:predicted hotdog family 3-hydroxylacyl-ACP dehydratase
MDNTTPLATEKEVLQWIPQRTPMVLIDTVWSANEQQATTGLTVQADTIFCQNGYLQAPALAENIAQTAAAQAGYLAQQANKTPPVGFIGAIKNLTIVDLPVVGEVLRTQITIEHHILNFTLVKGTVRVGERLIAEAEMKIFVAEAAN